MRHLLAWFSVVICACGSTTPNAAQQPTKTAEPAAKPTPPGLRLGTDVAPRHYALDLTIDPAKDHFQGGVDIDVEMAKAVPVIWLHAGRELEIEKATLDGTPVSVYRPEGDQIALEAPHAAGKARLHLEWVGAVSENDTRGLFRESEANDWYVFSQFEATSARRAFPCFDEPLWKTPFAITLHVPSALSAVANTAVAGVEAHGAMKTVRFAETKPLPSYLVALGVGPFDFVDGGKTKSGVPVRIVVPRGRGADGAEAAKVTASITDALEAYFGIPYPFDKLDILSVPKSTEFGAMENPGLITFVEDLVLGKAQNDSLGRQRDYAETAAHEIAHIWFGDFVTLPWWNDTWLNESFADWAMTRVLLDWAPTWHEDLEHVRSRDGALRLDTLKVARAIRQPIANIDDIEASFDGITYTKGDAVLTMFESWVGGEAFHNGVHNYLSAHAYGSGSTEDFLAAIGQAAGRDVTTPFSTFIDQAGAPLVSFSLKCTAKQAPVLAVTQRRVVTAGVEPDARDWKLPICVRYGAGKDRKRACTLLEEPTATLPLEGSCPEWVAPNAGGLGYYRSALDDDLLRADVRHLNELAIGERIALLSDLVALAQTGLKPTGDLLAVLPAFHVDTSEHLAATASRFLDDVHAWMVPPALEPAFAKLVDKLFGARARALGFENRPSDDYETRVIRQIAVSQVAHHAHDATLLAEARRLADRWLADHETLDLELAETVLAVAAGRGDKAFFDRLRKSLSETANIGEQRPLLFALGSFTDPAAIDAALGLLLDPSVDMRDAITSLRVAAATPESRDRVRAFVFAHFDALWARYPVSWRNGLLNVTANLCDEESLARYQAFFKDRVASMENGPRAYAQILERMNGCIAQRKLQEPSVRAFFSKHP